MGSLSLNTGLRALLSSQFVLDTVGHNLANANTPGYSRQRVNLSASLALSVRGNLVGSGVNIDRVERSVDELLGRRIQSQQSILGSLGARYRGLSELEAFVGASDTSSLSGLLDGFFTSVSDLSTSPADAIRRAGLVQSSRTLTTRLNEIGGQFASIQRDVFKDIGSRTKDVNGLASDIANLNVEIGKTELNGISANDLRDKRDALLDRLSEFVDITVVDNGNGTVGVLVAGNTLVGQGRANTMSVVRDASGNPAIQLSGSEGFVPVTGGEIGGLMALAANDMPGIATKFDDLAKQLALSVNRLHSTGVPPGGSFSILTGSNGVQDFDGDGKATDELLSKSGLPFDVVDGALYINVVEEASGDVVKSRIDIDASHTTVQGFLDEVNKIDNLTADIDASGRLRIVADTGYGFDFTSRLVPHPDTIGAFGGTSATLSTQADGPYSLAQGDTLTITADPAGAATPFTITFDKADFAEISQATAQEVADVINADPNAQANGIVAGVSGDSVVIKTVSGGASASFELTGGSSLGGFGWTSLAGATFTGQDNAVTPEILGQYTGTEDDAYTFRPNMDGTIGTTPGLTIDVLDKNGDLVNSLDVGSGYVPGTELEVAKGVSVKFNLGDLSQTNGDSFQVGLVPDADTSDVLVALGLNSYFEGSTASDLKVRDDIGKDPSLISTSLTGADGDSKILIDILNIKDAPQSEIGGASIGEFYGDVIAGLGFETASAKEALTSNDAVLQSLQGSRDRVSGVNVDEELVNMVAFQQTFQSASRFIAVTQQLNNELLNLI
ncbi:MAG TPA: flagellar hook-associated protein FlgK [Planctomycetes bacterium]|nr:flagellar hook-associated protein FlgK [Planctomycetota bacterium]